MVTCPLQGGTKYLPPSLYSFLTHLQKGRNFFWRPSREQTRGENGGRRKRTLQSNLIML